MCLSRCRAAPSFRVDIGTLKTARLKEVRSLCPRRSNRGIPGPRPKPPSEPLAPTPQTFRKPQTRAVALAHFGAPATQLAKVHSTPAPEKAQPASEPPSGAERCSHGCARRRGTTGNIDASAARRTDRARHRLRSQIGQAPKPAPCMTPRAHHLRTIQRDGLRMVSRWQMTFQIFVRERPTARS
jgi:hypothetical protein